MEKGVVLACGALLGAASFALYKYGLEEKRERISKKLKSNESPTEEKKGKDKKPKKKGKRASLKPDDDDSNYGRGKRSKHASGPSTLKERTPDAHSKRPQLRAKSKGKHSKVILRYQDLRQEIVGASGSKPKPLTTTKISKSRNNKKNKSKAAQSIPGSTGHASVKRGRYLRESKSSSDMDKKMSGSSECWTRFSASQDPFWKEPDYTPQFNFQPLSSYEELVARQDTFWTGNHDLFLQRYKNKWQDKTPLKWSNTICQPKLSAEKVSVVTSTKSDENSTVEMPSVKSDSRDNTSITGKAIGAKPSSATQSTQRKTKKPDEQNKLGPVVSGKPSKVASKSKLLNKEEAKQVRTDSPKFLYDSRLPSKKSTRKTNSGVKPRPITPQIKSSKAAPKIVNKTKTSKQKINIPADVSNASKAEATLLKETPSSQKQKGILKENKTVPISKKTKMRDTSKRSSNKIKVPSKSVQYRGSKDTKATKPKSPKIYRKSFTAEKHAANVKNPEKIQSRIKPRISETKAIKSGSTKPKEPKRNKGPISKTRKSKQAKIPSKKTKSRQTRPQALKVISPATPTRQPKASKSPNTRISSTEDTYNEISNTKFASEIQQTTVTSAHQGPQSANTSSVTSTEKPQLVSVKKFTPLDLKTVGDKKSKSQKSKTKTISKSPKQRSKKMKSPNEMKTVTNKQYQQPPVSPEMFKSPTKIREQKICPSNRPNKSKYQLSSHTTPPQSIFNSDATSGSLKSAAKIYGERVSDILKQDSKNQKDSMPPEPTETISEKSVPRKPDSQTHDSCEIKIGEFFNPNRDPRVYRFKPSDSSEHVTKNVSVRSEYEEIESSSPIATKTHPSKSELEKNSEDEVKKPVTENKARTQDSARQKSTPEQTSTAKPNDDSIDQQKGSGRSKECSPQLAPMTVTPELEERMTMNLIKPSPNAKYLDLSSFPERTDSTVPYGITHSLNKDSRLLLDTPVKQTSPLILRENNTTNDTIAKEIVSEYRNSLSNERRTSLDRLGMEAAVLHKTDCEKNDERVPLDSSSKLSEKGTKPKAKLNETKATPAESGGPSSNFQPSGSPSIAINRFIKQHPMTTDELLKSINTSFAKKQSNGGAKKESEIYQSNRKFDYLPFKPMQNNAPSSGQLSKDIFSNQIKPDKTQRSAFEQPTQASSGNQTELKECPYDFPANLGKQTSRKRTPGVSNASKNKRPENGEDEPRSSRKHSRRYERKLFYDKLSVLRKRCEDINTAAQQLSAQDKPTQQSERATSAPATEEIRSIPIKFFGQQRTTESSRGPTPAAERQLQKHHKQEESSPSVQLDGYQIASRQISTTIEVTTDFYAEKTPGPGSGSCSGSGSSDNDSDYANKMRTVCSKMQEIVGEKQHNKKT